MPPSSGVQGYTHPPLGAGPDTAGDRQQALGPNVEPYLGRQSLGSVDPSSFASRQHIVKSEMEATRPHVASIEPLSSGRLSLGSGGVDPVLTSRQPLDPLAGGRQLGGGDVGGQIEGYGAVEARYASDMHASGGVDETGRGLGGVST